MTNAPYSTRQLAGKYSLEYRCYLQNAAGLLISPFHDVPLYVDQPAGILNMVVEVPRFSNAKLEISKDERFNPIKQDVKKGSLRFVKNCFPMHGYLWNYGAFPQTWESPLVVDPETGMKGDKDPIDVLEIGSRIARTGEVRPVKVLGILAMIDEGETDWKVIAIDVADPLAPRLNDVSDVEAACPGLLDATRTWFRIYKIPDGKPANSFAFNGEVKDKAFAMKVIQATNALWKQLISGKVPNSGDDYKVSLDNRCNPGSPGHLKDGEGEEVAPPGKALPDNPIPESVHGWCFIPQGCPSNP